MTQRSTKGASKQRRDAINERVGQIRDLLPLSDVTRSRLSQLQVMALARAYIAKSNFFTDNYSGLQEDDRSSTYCEYFDFLQTVPGFLLIAGLDGRLLYVSDNISEFLGSSAVDTLTQMETIFDLVDLRDQAPLRAAFDEEASSAGSDGCSGSEWQQQGGAAVSLSCRMTTSVRNIRYVAQATTKNTFERFRAMNVSGRFVRPSLAAGLPAGFNHHYRQQQRNGYGSAGLNDGGTATFVAVCTPRLCVADSLATAAADSGLALGGDTTAFRSLHALDMKFLAVDSVGEYYLDCEQRSIAGKSWYERIVPEDLHEAQRCHMELIRSTEIGDLTTFQSLCVRVQARAGELVWLHVIMRMRSSADDADDDATMMSSMMEQQQMQQPQLIVCINRVVDEQEAASIRSGEMEDYSTVETTMMPGGAMANGAQQLNATLQNGYNAMSEDLFSTLNGEDLFGSSCSSLGPYQPGNGSGYVTGLPVSSGRQVAPHQGGRQKRKVASAAAGGSSGRQGGSTSKIPRTSSYGSHHQMSSSSFTTMPSPPLYQQHWNGGSFQDLDTYSAGFPPSSSFPSSFRSLTPPGSVYQQDSTVGYVTMSDSIRLSFGLAPVKQEHTVASPAPLSAGPIPDYFLTPEHSPASFRDCATSPTQSVVSDSSSTVSCSSTRMLRDMDIFIPSSFRGNPCQQQSSPPARAFPEPPPQQPESLNFPGCDLLSFSADELSFFDGTVPYTDDVKLIDPDFIIDSAMSPLPPDALNRMFSAHLPPPQDRILINCDFLPELDLPSVDSILDGLEMPMAASKVVPLPAVHSASAGSEAGAGGRRLAMEGFAAAGTIDEMLMSIRNDLMRSVATGGSAGRNASAAQNLVSYGSSCPPRLATMTY